MNLKFRNRVSLYFISTTSLLVLLVFFIVYFVVYKSVYNQVNENLIAEAEENRNNITFSGDTIVFNSSFEWFEQEHSQLEANPVYVEIIDSKGNLINKSPNLLNKILNYDPVEINNITFNTTLSEIKIRQYQEPIRSKDYKLLGYIIVAVPFGEYEFVLSNLKLVLIISFPIVIIILFLFSKYITGKSIFPIYNVINTAEKITKENLKERINLPAHKDEIYSLVNTINSLLDRIEESVIREKQFTSDASHELRTPLSVIKGTLEVLIRKPRDIKEYVEKINYCIKETDRISVLIEQLLLLARYEREDIETNIEVFDLTSILITVIHRYDDFAKNKNIKIVYNEKKEIMISADKNMTEVMIDNIYSNALKYTPDGGFIYIDLVTSGDFILCKIRDTGFGIPEELLNKIFDRFYRIDASRNSKIKGYGLGLSIVKKLADIQNIKFNIESKLNEGTSVSYYFNKT